MQRKMTLTSLDEGSEVTILAADNGGHLTVSIVIGGVCVAAIGVPRPVADARLLGKDTAQLTREPALITNSLPHGA